MSLENTVKELIKKQGTQAKKAENGFVYELEHRGNAYDDFREEYSDADIIDDRVARRALPNQEGNEKYLVLMSSDKLEKSKLKEIHNTRFASYANSNLIVSKKNDVVEGFMKALGIVPEDALRKDNEKGYVPNPIFPKVIGEMDVNQEKYEDKKKTTKSNVTKIKIDPDADKIYIK